MRDVACKARAEPYQTERSVRRQHERSGRRGGDGGRSGLNFRGREVAGLSVRLMDLSGRLRIPVNERSSCARARA